MKSYGFDFADYFNTQRALGVPEPWAQDGESCGAAQMPNDALSPHVVPNIPMSITVDALERAWAEVRTLSLEASVAEAMAATAEPANDIATDTGHDLTPRQLEVLRLVIDGLSNRAIADSLSLSERTVEHHVMHILDRLGVDSRTAAATHAVREGLV